MIFFTNRAYETIAIADRDSVEGLRLVDDTLNQAIKTGTAIYEAKIEKNDKSVEKIEVGCFVFVPNFKGKILVLEIMEVKESTGYKGIVAEDAGLELINSDVGEHKMYGSLKDHILLTLGKDSDWSIGINEIDDSKSLSLEYTGVSNQTKRIVEIAGRFGAEVSYDFVFDGNRIKEKKINFLKERGNNTALRLEVGKELKEVKRNISITNLRTAILGQGQPVKETIKTTKTVKKKEPKSASEGKIKPFIDWFRARLGGKSSYSMYNRMGPRSYDCSSAVHFAAKHAGLIPKDHMIGSTETLFGMKGKYLDEISRSDIRKGDIFIAGRQGASGGANGHTGAVVDSKHIIHCSYSKNGIAITPIDGYTGGPPVRWFRWRNSGYGVESQGSGSGRYWTNSDISKHDLGFKLVGLSAGQLNNWIRSASPNCPFVGQGAVFIEAEKQSGLDARYILAHAALESAWGKSNIAKRYNNYFGIGAFDNDPDNARNFSNSGLASGIINGAKWIANNYYRSSYRQTTLDKMRHNNGVHQYATDPNWHTKIAKLMKNSERYTNPSGTRVMEETKLVEAQVDKDTNLIGYKYDDGRFFVDEQGRLCDRVANKTWANPNSKGKYLCRVYKSEATSQKSLFDECLAQLKKYNEPEISYEVNPDKIPKEVDLGDRVRIIDNDFTPALYLEARLVDVTYSTTSEFINKAVFANFVPKTSGIAESLFSLQKYVHDFKYDWDHVPYVMELSSSSGNIFKDDIIETNLVASISKAGIDQSALVDGFIWERVSRYQDKLVVKDEEWNESKKEYNEHFIDLGRSDIELEASFVCTAMVNGVGVASASYTIKNLAIGIYKQEKEPDRKTLQWGDVWQWDGGDGKHFKRVWKGDKWEDTVTKRDLELLELTPGPPGRDGKDGMPGKKGADGRTSYMHFAYADSADGVVGFVLTATKGKKYIGFYSDFEKDDSKDPKKYEWSKYVGDDGKPGRDGANGIAGKAGVDGKTPYFHTAWANSADGSKDFSVSQAGEKAYIGTYADYTKEDSTDPKKYAWQLVKGKQGERGEPGQKGAPGRDGKDGHTLTVQAYFSGTLRNHYTKTVRAHCDVFYDGTKIRVEDTDAEYTYFIDGVNTKPVKDRPSSNDAFTDELKPNCEFIEIVYTVSYKGLKARSVARLVNVNDGANGIDGKDGKTGKIGQNLLRNSNVPVSNKNYPTNIWNICETLNDNEIVTFTMKVKVDRFSSFGIYNSGGAIYLSGKDVIKEDDYKLIYSTFPWKTWQDVTWGEKHYEQTNPPSIHLYNTTLSKSQDKTTTSVEWATLTRGDIPAIEWSPCYADVDEALANKANNDSVNKVTSSLQALQVHFAMYPSAEELKKTQIEQRKQEAYLDQLKKAVDSNALSLEDRLAIIETNVGAGKLTLEAISTYLNFGEEGVLIGKEGEQVRLRLINNALEITDGSKVVARFANNQTETPNLRVTGVFEFGYHVASKVDLKGKKFTVISPNI